MRLTKLADRATLFGAKRELEAAAPATGPSGNGSDDAQNPLPGAAAQPDPPGPLALPPLAAPLEEPTRAE